jgi:hypothetical protein
MTQVQEKPFRIAVSIPAGDSVKTGFAFDLANMVGATAAMRDDVLIRIHTVQTSIIARSRESLVFSALQADCTHMLFLDSDMRFPRHTLLHLLSRNEYIVGANYATRAMPVRPVTFRDDADPSLRVYTEAGQTGLEEVPSIGFGVVLIDLDVFRSLSRPWFSFEWDAQSRQLEGEDVGFCRKARRELGAKVYVDHDLSHEVKHIGSWEFSLEHAREVRDSAAAQQEAPRIIVPHGD